MFESVLNTHFTYSYIVEKTFRRKQTDNVYHCTRSSCINFINNEKETLLDLNELKSHKHFDGYSPKI